jgi:glycine/D-amino acid oxidase-like deaminating enzyme
LAVEQLTADETRRRFRGFVVPEGCETVFERDAGYLLVEDCVRTHVEEAQRLGAELHTGEAVQSWRVEQGTVVVETDQHRYSAASLVLSPGAWATQLLADLGVPLHVVRKHLHWFANDDARLREENGCPAFFYETPQGYYYGFPQIGPSGLKAAEHSGGETVADPLAVDRSVDAAELARVQGFLGRHLPGVSPQAFSRRGSSRTSECGVRRGAVGARIQVYAGAGRNPGGVGDGRPYASTHPLPFPIPFSTVKFAPAATIAL